MLDQPYMVKFLYNNHGLPSITWPTFMVIASHQILSL